MNLQELVSGKTYEVQHHTEVRIMMWGNGDIYQDRQPLRKGVKIEVLRKNEKSDRVKIIFVDKNTPPMVGRLEYSKHESLPLKLVEA